MMIHKAADELFWPKSDIYL